jgi:hypothetical protein
VKATRGIIFFITLSLRLVGQQDSSTATKKAILFGLIPVVPVDSISTGRFHVGLGVGNDFFLQVTGVVSAGYYLINIRSFCVSAEAKVGASGFFALMGYVYPNLNIQARISRIWISTSAGPEFGYVIAEGGNSPYLFRCRLDAGVRVFTENKMSCGITVPIRIIDSPLPVMGIQIGLAYKISKRDLLTNNY